MVALEKLRAYKINIGTRPIEIHYLIPSPYYNTQMQHDVLTNKWIHIYACHDNLYMFIEKYIPIQIKSENTSRYSGTELLAVRRCRCNLKTAA